MRIGAPRAALVALALLLVWREHTGDSPPLRDKHRLAAVRSWPSERKGQLRVLFLGDSNDRMLVSEWCALHGNLRIDEKDIVREATRACTGAGTGITIAFVWFRFFHTLLPSFDCPNSTTSIEVALHKTLSDASLAATQALDGPPDAVIFQSLFHDLMWTYVQSPSNVHGMYASDELWGRWLSVWSTIAMIAMRTIARSDLSPLWRQPRWIGWRTANHVGQGDHDGWLYLAEHITLANAEAARIARLMGVELVDFATFTKSVKLKDWTHPELVVHGEFSSALLKNLSLLLAY